jgi:biopolymer transport protein ExbB
VSTATATWLFILLTTAVLGQAAPAATGGEENAAVAVQSVWDFIVKGGPMMVPIGLCSLVALTVAVERLVSLRRRQVIPPEFLPTVRRLLDNDDSGRDDALDYCRDNGSSIANIFAAGIKRLGQPVEVIEKYIEDAGQREVVKLRKYLRLFSVIAAISPLLGLLGTIFGMIDAFQTVAASGAALGRTELLAKGIYQAMITTAAGLMVAIPVLVAYHGLSAKIDRLVGEIDMRTVDFVDEYAALHDGSSRAEPRLRAHADEKASEPEEVAEEAVSLGSRTGARAG